MNKNRIFKVTFAAMIFILIMVLNIILGCSTVFKGKYSCYDKKQETYYEIIFYDNTFDYYKNSPDTVYMGENQTNEERYYGFYLYKLEKGIIYLDFGDFTKLSGVSDLDCKRQSVFSFTVSTARGLWYEDKYEIEFRCTEAIILQVIYIFIMLACLSYIIYQVIKLKNKK